MGGGEEYLAKYPKLNRWMDRRVGCDWDLADSQGRGDGRPRAAAPVPFGAYGYVRRFPFRVI